MATKAKVSKAPKAKTPATTGRVVEMLEVKTMLLHPLLDVMPMRPEVAIMLEAEGRTEEAAEMREAWDAFCANVDQHGVIDPVSYVQGPKGPEIIKGRHRWRASQKMGVQFIPAIKEPEDRAREIILGEAGHRLNHVSKEASAYMAVLFYPHLAAVTRGGDRSKPQQTAEIAVCPPEAKLLTRAEAADMVGCSLRLIEEACATYKDLAEKPAMRKKMEPLIVTGQIGLGAARAGAAGGASTEGKPRKPSNFASVSRTLRSLGSQVRNFEDWDAEDRKAAVETLTAMVDQWPLEWVEAIKAAIAAAEDGMAGKGGAE